MIILNTLIISQFCIHQFSKDIIQKVNKFPEEMMALQIEEEGGREIREGERGGFSLQLVETFL